MKDVVRPWMDRVANGRPYVFQQDSAPAHASKKTQAWLIQNLPHHWPPDVWPPNSQDLNPLDYFVLGVLKTKTNATFHTSVDAIKQAVVEQFALLDKESLVKACRVFRTRVEAVIAAEGGYIEK